MNELASGRLLGCVCSSPTIVYAVERDGIGRDRASLMGQSVYFVQQNNNTNNMASGMADNFEPFNDVNAEATIDKKNTKLLGRLIRK